MQCLPATSSVIQGGGKCLRAPITRRGRWTLPRCWSILAGRPLRVLL